MIPPVTTTVSSGTPPAQAPAATPNPNPGPAASPQPGGTPAEDVAAIKARVAELQGQAAEHQRNAQFWYEKANKGGAKPEKDPPAATEDNVDVLDLITTKGAKGLDKLLMAKRGYIRKEDAESLVNSKAAQLTKRRRSF